MHTNSSVTSAPAGDGFATSFRYETQLYQYLRHRQDTGFAGPLYLKRNLKYIRRPHLYRRRESFAWDDLAKSRSTEQSIRLHIRICAARYLCDDRKDASVLGSRKEDLRHAAISIVLFRGDEPVERHAAGTLSAPRDVIVVVGGSEQLPQCSLGVRVDIGSGHDIHTAVRQWPVTAAASHATLLCAPVKTAGPPMCEVTLCVQARQALISRVANGTRAPSSLVRYRLGWNGGQHYVEQLVRGFACPWCGTHWYDMFGLLMHLTHFHRHFAITHLLGGEYGDVPVVCVKPSKCCGPTHLNPNNFVFDARTSNVDKRLIGRDVREFHDGSVPVPLRHPAAKTIMSPSGCNTREEEVMTFHSNDSCAQLNLFFRSRTRMPLHASLMETDSEDENDLGWLRDSADKLLEELTDVNEGESSMMKLWNGFIMSQRCLAQGRLLAACEEFLEQMGSHIQQVGLRNNFVLHLINLRDFRLLTTENVVSIVESFNSRFGIASV